MIVIGSADKGVREDSELQIVSERMLCCNKRVEAHRPCRHFTDAAGYNNEQDKGRYKSIPSTSFL
jgi:hypothetical protein